MRRHKTLIRFLAILFLVAVALAGVGLRNTKVGAAGTAVKREPMYTLPAPNFDLNRARKLKALRQPTPDQLSAIQALKAASSAGSVNVRWNDFGGSPDIVMGFASAPLSGTPEEAGRAFLASNSALFGIQSLADLRLVSDQPAFGGHLLRFQQSYGGIDVHYGGVGLMLNSNNQVVMASGPFFRGVSVNTTPTLTAAQARQAAAADLARYSKSLPQYVQDMLRPAFDALSKQLQAVQALEPKLGIYPTVDGYRLVWKVAKFSTNPFGLYGIFVDAHTGELVMRQDFVSYQNPATGQPFKGDIYPKYPDITNELKDQSIISDCGGAPCGQVRATLRKFDASNMATGINGTLTGQHALVNNILPTKQPFLQAAKGTWYFQKDDAANFEARTNEQDQFAEPAEHQDEINAFFFVTYLVEYIDDIHRRDDSLHNRIGQGDFPDAYPNNDVPLPATVHCPNVLIAEQTGRFQEKPAEAVQIVLGLDNALAYNATGLVRLLTGVQTPVNANPTVYGHGWRYNDLALEGTVPYHEGMHAISSPIAGLEGDPEGGAMNEGQADMWAFTITNSTSLGEYVINSKGIRDRLRSQGQDPDSLAYIRSARSSLKYSDMGTYFNPDTSAYEFEPHRDGEVYMSTMWDIREMLNRVYPNATTYKRPKFEDGVPQRPITQGTETFERIFLGSLYILGTMQPDTYIRARDAMILADQSLYPSDPTDPTAPGLHRALIEQVFAAHEMGVNAREVIGDKATISTQVTPFVGAQAAPAAPQNVQVEPASARTLAVTWSPVQGAVAYEVLKRKVAYRDRREPNGAREYLDGDAQTTGWRHVAYVGANSTYYEDRGKIEEVFAAAGLSNLFDSEYAVRAIQVNASKQLGFSDLSGAALPVLASQDVTTQVDTALSNVSFSGGVFAFDNKVTNARGANSTDKTIYAPVEFSVKNISDPGITVKNADKNGNTFVYNTTLPLGSSATRRLEFNDPLAKMFTFDAQVTGMAFAGSTGGTGSQAGDGSSEPPPSSFTYSVRRDEYTGVMPLGDPTGLTHGSGVIEDEEVMQTDADPNFKGVTYVDIPVTTTGDSIMLDAELTSLNAVDYDLELRTADGQTRLDRSAETENFAHEHIRYLGQPNTTYIIRIIGFVNVASDYKVVVRQFLPQGSANANSGDITINSDGSETAATTGGGAVPVTGVVRRLVRYTVNPLTKSVTIQVLK